MKHRFFLSAPLAPGTVVTVEGDEFHHARRVRRVAPGEAIELFDGNGVAVDAEVREIRSDGMSVVVVAPAPSREPGFVIRLALALIPIDRFELALQKGTELGVARFTPVIAGRSEINPARIVARRQRWACIALEAVKQSGRSMLPVIDEPLAFRDVITAGGTRILFDADEESAAMPSSVPDTITLLIGPEGGWSVEERDAARRSGCLPRRLGPRRLRSETAAIAAVTLIQAAFGDLSVP